MPTAFDDLLPPPTQSTGGAFDDLVPQASKESAFADLTPALTPERVATKLRDPAYTPTREEFQVWKDSEDAKGWFQPGEWMDAFGAGAGAIKDTAVKAGASLFGQDSILENPMRIGQTALEAGARGAVNDAELLGRKIPATIGRGLSAVAEVVVPALTGTALPDSREAYFLNRKLIELNRALNPTGSPTFETITPATLPPELQLQWQAEYRNQAKPAAEYQDFLSKRADQQSAVARSEGRANLVPPILAPTPDNAIAEAGSLVANPTTVMTFGLGAAPRTGATLLERAAASAATGIGKAAGATGRAAQLVAKFPSAVVARGVELAGGTADTAAAAAKLVEGGSIGATLASPAVAVPGLTQAAIAMQATKRGGQLLEAAGDASGAVGRSLAQGPSRTGLLGTIATDGKAPEWIRKAAANARALDPALEFAGRTFESGVHGAGIGAVFGGLAEGNMEGVAQGAGAGFGLGAGFGTVGRAVGFRANLEAKRQADLNRWFGGKSPEEQAQLHALGMDRNQALRLATTEEFVRGMRGANGESDVRFQYVDNATFERAFGTSAKGAEHIAADQPVIVINVDRANGRTPLHEAMHGLLDLGLSPETKAELQRKLFTQQAPDGTVLTEGVFSFDDQQRSLQQYTARLAPQARAEFHLQTPAEQLAKIRTEMAAEAFANLVEGKGPDYLLKDLTGVRRRMADSLVQAQQGTILATMRKGLEAVGVKFDGSGAPSELFVKNGKPVTNSPEVDAALRDYLRAKTKVLNRLAAADDAPSGLVVTRQDMMSKNAKAVAELFKDNDNFKKDATGAVVIERGLPVLNTPREIAKVQSKRVDEIISALDRAPRAIGGSARQPMRLKPNGAWEGHYFTPEQLAEIDRIPDSVIAPSLKAKIRQLNDLHAPGDGRRYVIDYNAATKEAKGGGRVYSSSISSTLRDVVPLTFHVSKAGNFYTTTLDTTAMHAKLNRWFKEHRRVFDAWGGNRDAFVADVFKYLDNHASDRPGSYGLDAGAATAVHKKNVINDLFGVARGSGANPIDLSTKAGKDNLIKSFRLDRTNRITDSGGEKMPFDYYKAKANLLPEEPVDDYVSIGFIPTQADIDAAAGRTVRRPQAAGKEWNATTPSAGVPVKGKYELREAKDLVTSFDAGFDAALQPRDRTREASVNQIAGIVQKFEPQRLGEAPTTDLGAPVIDDAGQVLSGNGRVTSLRTIYGAQDASRGDGYKQFLMQNAEQFGFKAADIAGMTEPVLVRRVDDYGGLAKAEFARQSNQSQLLAMSGAEKAAADARLLTEHPDILDKFAPSEEGNVMATSNHEFLNHFIAATGDQAELLSGKGYNNELVRKRVETAILATVIGPENRKLITQMIERADKFKMRKAVNGLMMSAPSLVKLKGTAYDLSAYLSQAMGDLVRMRGASENVETFLASKPLVGDDGRTAASDHILEFLSKAKSQKQVAEDLRRYLFMAKNAISDAQSGGLFGDTPRSREQLLGEIYGRIIRPTEPANLPATAPSAFAELIPAEAAQPAASAPPVAAQPVPAPAAVSPAPVAPAVVTAPVPPPHPRNGVVADWSFRNGSPQIRADAGSYLPTGSALRASANEIVQHTRDEAAYAFAERLGGLPRNTGLLLAREFLAKAEARQPAGLLATERTRRAAALLVKVPAEKLHSVFLESGLDGVRERLMRSLQ